MHRAGAEASGGGPIGRRLVAPEDDSVSQLTEATLQVHAKDPKNRQRPPTEALELPVPKRLHPVIEDVVEEETASNRPA